MLSSEASGLTDPEPQREHQEKVASDSSGESLLQGKRPPTVDLTYQIEKFAACWAPRSGMLWEDCQSLSEPLTATSPCCSST